MTTSLENDYLKKLFKLNIKEKLGDISPEQKAILFKIDQQYGIKRASSDKGVLKSTSAELDLDALNQLFNEELKEYQKVLSDEEYFKLFGASKVKRLTLEINNYVIQLYALHVKHKVWYYPANWHAKQLELSLHVKQKGAILSIES